MTAWLASSACNVPWDTVVGVVVRFKGSQQPLAVPVALLLDRNDTWRRRGTVEVVDVPTHRQLSVSMLGKGGKHKIVDSGTYRSTMHTSGGGRTAYRASVARPIIHGPGSSM